jgi:hypothetical protein
MSKKSYQTLLQDPRWKARSKEIMQKDRFRCVSCSESKNLNVHHISYKKEFTFPWDYDDNELMTLCESCHKALHDQIDAARIALAEHFEKGLRYNTIRGSSSRNIIDADEDREEQLNELRDDLDNLRTECSDNRRYIESIEGDLDACRLSMSTAKKMLERVWPFIYEDIHCDDITMKYKRLIYDVSDLLGKNPQRKDV